MFSALGTGMFIVLGGISPRVIPILILCLIARNACDGMLRFFKEALS
ncbi:MAG: hypothetical protein JSR80_01430 [Verrucomicrobia bacterium]|nr:hypothetical protein [Verrucomicrobiota bacterium]